MVIAKFFKCPFPLAVTLSILLMSASAAQATGLDSSLFKNGMVSGLLPADAYLLNILSFGDKADRDAGLILEKFADDTIFLFGYKNSPEEQKTDSAKQGLCALDGLVLVPAMTGKILFYEPGKAIIETPGSKCSIVDLHTWSIVPTNLRLSDSAPSLRIPRNHYGSPSVPNDRVRTVRKYGDDSFDSDYWKETRFHPISGIEMFNRFLVENDLIGMKRLRVTQLLGEPRTTAEWLKKGDSLLYRFGGMSCMGAFSGVRIHFKNECVSGWSFVDCPMFGQEPKEFKLITTNVVIKPQIQSRAIGGSDLKDTIAKTEPKYCRKQDEISSTARLVRLNTLLEYLRKLRRSADEAWDNDIASNTSLRQTNDGYWRKHRQDKAIDERIEEIQYRIKKLEQSKTKDRTKS